MRIIGVDHSLTSTGLAYVVPADGVIELRTIATEPERDGETLEHRADRVARIARRFSDLLDGFEQDGAGGPLLMVIETRDFQTKTREGGHPTDRAGLWMQLLMTGRVYGAHLAGVAPTTLKVYATGDGRASKEAVKDAVETTYGVRCRNDDESDALAAAAMAADFYGMPLVEVGDRQRRTIGRPRWPMIAGTVRRP